MVTTVQPWSLTHKDVLDGMQDLPSLPVVVLELMQALDDSDQSVHELVTKLGRDLALSAKVLRLANSAFYGLQRHVESLEDAVAVLGVQSVRTLACVAAVTGTYYWRIQRPEDRWTFESFWRHSMAVALGARAVARQSGLSEGHAFVAGLLHDIGWLVLRTSFPRQLAAVEQEQLQTGERWEVVEARVLGMDHAEIGRILLEHWKFPAALCEAVGDHHPSEAQEHGLGAVVCVANWLDHVRQLPVEQRFSIVSQAHHCCQVLGLSATWWPGVLDELEQQLNGACDVLLRQEES